MYVEEMQVLTLNVHNCVQVVFFFKEWIYNTYLEKRSAETEDTCLIFHACIHSIILHVN